MIHEREWTSRTEGICIEGEHVIRHSAGGSSVKRKIHVLTVPLAESPPKDWVPLRGLPGKFSGHFTVEARGRRVYNDSK